MEDDEDEVLLMGEAVRDAGADDITLNHAATLKTALSKLANGTYDAVLLDLSLPDSSGLEGVPSVVQAAGKAPVIVCTGLNDESVGQDAIRSGAQDYLVKNPQLYGSLPRILRYAVERSRLIYQANRKLELAREYTELLLTKVISIANSGLGITNDEGIFIIVNPALADLVGCATADIVGTPWTNLVVKQDRATELKGYKKAFSRPENYDRKRLRIERKDGRIIAVPMASVLVDFDEDRLCRVLSFGSPLQAGSSSGPASPKGRCTANPKLRVDDSATRLSVGRLQMVGLETAKAEAGDRWPAIAGRVFAMAEETIAGHLSISDSFTRNQDDDFIICFDGLSEHQAFTKTLAISSDLRQRILALDADGEFADLGLDSGIWRDLAEIKTESHALEVGPEELQGAPDPTTLITKKIDEATARARANINARVAALKKSCCTRLREAHKRQGSGVSLMLHDFDADTRLQVTQLMKAEEDNASLAAEVDCIALGRAVRQIDNLTVKKVPLVVVDVHFSTLVDRALFSDYASACKKLDERTTKSLVFNIKGVPPNIRKSKLAAATKALSPFSQLRMIELERPDLGSLDLRGASIPLVTIAYDNMLGTYYRNPSQCIDLVNKVHKAGARMVIDRVTSRDGSYLFRDLGVDFISYEPSWARQS